MLVLVCVLLENGLWSSDNSSIFCLTTQRKYFPPTVRSTRFKVRNILVPNGVYIDYVHSTVTIFNDRRVLHRFKGIRVFQVYDVLTGYSTFYPSRKRIRFEGYGKCHRYSLLTIEVTLLTEFIGYLA